MIFFQLMVMFCIIFLNRVECQHPDYVLPTNIKPLRYVISIHSFNTTNFKGSVLIELEAKEESSNITLHAKNLEIDDRLISIIHENGREVKWNQTSLDPEKDFFIITLNDNLDKGTTYNLTIDQFTGSLIEAKEGLFSGIYTDINGNKNTFIMTEFEPSHARKAFPCFDQPNFKAQFILRIIRPAHLHAAFNTPLQDSLDLGNGSYLDVFKETPIMSTYLVAFIVSNLEYTKPNGIIRILAQAHHATDGSTDFILEESSKILEALEEYTGIKYALDKIDMVAVPEGYFLDGAMENWGLITFSEKYLVCPITYSNQERQKCLTFTTHEIAHQWFGNLATHSSWPYIWLSEGFASYFQYYISDIVEPTWRVMEQYVLDELEVSLKNELYSLGSIEFTYTSPDSNPDPNVYYRKASAIIRMTQHILTDEIHRNGLRIYLQNHKFDNTEPVDVYQSYQQAVENANATHLLGNMTVYEILATWIKYTGLPLVTVTRDYSARKVTFSQKLFDSAGHEEKKFWKIPITYALESSEHHCDFNRTTTDVWLTGENVTVDIGTNDGWILVNKHAVGYYRVTYDETNWERLTTYLNSKNYFKIPPVNRARLLYDAYALVTTNQLKNEVFFNLTSYMEQEIDYIPISAFVDILEEADVWRVESKKLNIIKKYLGKLLTFAYKRIISNPKDNDTHMDGLIRNTLEKIMCNIDQQDCVARALDAVSSWIETGEMNISTSLKKHWLCAVMKTAPVSAWEFLLKEYYVSNDTVSKKTYVYALTCAQDTHLLDRFLNITFDVNDPMLLEDKLLGLDGIVSRNEGAQLVIRYIETIDVDERYCSYFSGVEPSFLVPLSRNVDRQKLEFLLRKRKLNCLPISFYKEDANEGHFAVSLSEWCQKRAS